MANQIRLEDLVIEDEILKVAGQAVQEYKLAYKMFLEGSASRPSREIAAREYTVDEIVVEANQVIRHFDEFTKHELDSIIGDMSYVLAFLKRNDRAGQHWRGCTLDMETQAHICKVAYIEVVLTQIEERRMEMTMECAAEEEEKERLRRRKRMILHRGVSRLRDLKSRLELRLERRRKGVSCH